ncbi:MAG: class I SAM-dependent methyltransferase [Terriglobia bacterium]
MGQNHRPPSPDLIFDTLNAFQRSAALKTAIELEIFSAIGAGATTAGAMAAKTIASERGLRILCDFLVVCNLLTKDGMKYGLTPDSAAFLDKRSPSYMGSCIGFLSAPEIRKGFDDLTAAVRKGGTTSRGSTEANWPAWVEFARSMAPMMAMPAQLLAERFAAMLGDGPVKLLDIAAGHGLYGIAMARKNPQLEVVALDWPAVLEVAKENAVKAGVAARYRWLPGSALEVAFGDGYQAVLLTNFLHHFDKPTNEVLLRKVHRSLAPGGKAIALEFVPNEDRVSPPTAAAFSLTMLASTPAGDAYTFSEYQEMFTNAGFAQAELYPLPPTFSRVVVGARDKAAANSPPRPQL